MNRKGFSVLIPIFTIAVGLLLTIILLSNGEQIDVPTLGIDQQAVYNGYATQDSLTQYAQGALQQALTTAAKSGSDDLQQEIQSIFLAQIREHPLAPDTLDFEITKQGSTYTMATRQPITLLLKNGAIADRLAHVEWNGGTFTSWPMDQDKKAMSCAFGYRGDSSGSKNHPAIDIPGDVGDNVYSVAPGTVTYTGDISIGIDHGEVTCEYLHIKNFQVGRGATVEQGQKIAELAAYSGGEHLDFRCYQSQPLLTRERAEQLFTPELVKDTTTVGEPSPLAIYSETKVYTDPYCLFAPESRSGLRLQVADTIKNCNGQLDLYRRDGTFEHKMAETCERYASAGLYDQEPQTLTEPSPLTGSITETLPRTGLPHGAEYPSEQSTRQWIETTLRYLRDNQVDGVNLLQMTREVALQENVDEKILLAMTVIESGGNPQARSQTGVCGLVQVTESTFRDQVPNFDGDHCAPRPQLIASSRYIKFLTEKFGATQSPLAFMAAAYNGGQGTIDSAIANTGLASPTYLEMVNALPSTPAKAEEITNHGLRFAAVYEKLGGADLQPLYATREGRSQAVGSYSFDVEVSATLTAQDQAFLQNLEELKIRLSQLPAQNLAQITSTLIQQQGRLAGLEDCTQAAHALSKTTAACSTQQWGNTCACKIELPHREESVIYEAETITSTFDGETSENIADWIGEQEAPLILTTLSPDSTGDSIQVIYDSSAPRQLDAEYETLELDEDAFYVNLLPGINGLQLVVSPTGNACEAPTYRTYCNDELSFDIAHES